MSYRLSFKSARDRGWRSQVWWLCCERLGAIPWIPQPAWILWASRQEWPQEISPPATQATDHHCTRNEPGWACRDGWGGTVTATKAGLCHFGGQDKFTECHSGANRVSRRGYFGYRNGCSHPAWPCKWRHVGIPLCSAATNFRDDAPDCARGGTPPPPPPPPSPPPRRACFSGKLQLRHWDTAYSMAHETGLPQAPPNAAHAFPEGLPQPGAGQSCNWDQNNSAQSPVSVLGSASQGNLRFGGASQQYAPPANTASYAGLLQNSGVVSADSLPQIDFLSPQLQADILASKDVNLASLLIPVFKSQEDPNQRHLVVDGDVIPLKGLTDSRLNKKTDHSGIHPGFHYV